METENKPKKETVEEKKETAEKTVVIPALPDKTGEKATAEAKKQQRQMTATIVVAVIVVLAILIGSIVFLASNGERTEVIRDIFIIFMALESLVIGISLIILLVQLARLINLLQNEIKPILDTTNESVNTLRGTVAFLSNNVTEPVMKLNEYLAAVKQVGSFMGFSKNKKPKKE